MEPSEIRHIINLLEGKEEKLTLSPLPYDMGDLSPVLSKDNVDYHYNVLPKGMLIGTIKKKEILNLITVEQCYTICFGLNFKNHQEQTIL